MWRWDQQEPFGVNVPDENPSSLGMFEFPLRFPGQYADKETNLYYNYFRDYDPYVGRYAESDPVGLYGGLNTYGYVGQDPLGITDPRGLVWGAGAGALTAGGRIIISQSSRNWKRITRAAANAIARAQKSPNQCDPDDYCDQMRRDEDEDCWNNYGEWGRFDVWRACTARAFERWRLCKRNKGDLPPDAPPRWTDNDWEGR